MSLPVPSAELRETHTVAVACIGGHFGEDAFIEARAEFDWLDAWLDPPSIVDDNVPGSPDETVVRVGRSELARAEIVGGTLRLITGVAGREGPSAIHLDRWSAVGIELNEPQPWQTILDSWIRPFHDLLTISIGRPVRLTELRLRPADAGPRAPLCNARFGVVQAQGKASPSPQGLLNYSAPTLVTRRDAGVPLDELLTAWYELWVREREAFMHLLAPFHASFMYSQRKFGAAFQAVEALHHKPRFTSGELDRRSHQERVAAIVRAAQAAGVEEDTVAWAERVLRSRNDKPLTVCLSAANTHDSMLLEAVIDAVPPVKGPRGRPGRPRKRPAKLHLDKAYDYPRCRRALRARGITPRIAGRGIESSLRLGRHRYVVERSLAWLVGYRRLRVRYERRADILLGFLFLACALICLNSASR
jgi:transposase